MKLAGAFIAIVATLAALTVAGCSETTVYFTPAARGGGSGGYDRARYVLAAEKGDSAVAFLSARGVTGNKKKEGDEQLDRLIVSLTVRNRLGQPVALPAKQFYAVDDDGTRLASPIVYSKQAEDAGVVAPPGQVARAQVTFLMPAGRSLMRIGSFRLFWSAAVGGKPESYQTKFLRSAEPEEDYYYPYGYYPYGYYPYGYYPYDYGYPYGFYGGFGGDFDDFHHGGGHHGGRHH